MIFSFIQHSYTLCFMNTSIVASNYCVLCPKGTTMKDGALACIQYAHSSEGNSNVQANNIGISDMIKPCIVNYNS